MPSPELLRINNLSVAFGPEGARQRVVDGVSFSIKQGEKRAIVGESGSGKSVTAMSILGLHDLQQVEYGGEVWFQDENLLALSQNQLRSVRGGEIAMIFQEPMTSLNPVFPIGEQLMEPLLVHQGLSKPQAKARMLELLDLTGIPEPAKRFDAFPHMLSGGQRQRVMIAMALACRPKLLIADEPTTALDVTVQAQILELLEDLQLELNMAVLLISHDLNLVRQFSDSICVMKQGQVVETAQTETLFTDPQHNYTKALLSSRPERLVRPLVEKTHTAPLLRATNIRCHFPIKSAGFLRKTSGWVKAVDGVDVQLAAGETLGIVGESGSGKSTLGLNLLQLQAGEGEVLFNYQKLNALSRRQLRPMRHHMQIVFQDPYSSLSPRMTVEQIIGEGLEIHFPDLDHIQRRKRIVQVLEEVGLDETLLWRYPHEFSGGQRQRIAIARVVVLEPKLVMLDEPTSALDVSVQKQVLELLHRLQQDHGMSYLFISHDLAVIRAMSHRVLVMKEGKVVESGETEGLFNNPQHAYTKTLLSASLLAEAVD
ncbi:MAG: ABC transporter ATP-binding protein [Gammaproteobacteria bacterium]|nr:ABC transporter ATP-binding protein [Gammaproteobacteria bacterium]